MLPFLKSRRYNVTTAAWDAISRTHLVLRLSPEGQITWCNDAFLELSGYRADELLGQRHRVLCADDDWGSEDYRSLWNRLRAGHDESGVFKRIAKDGRELWLRASYSPVFNAVGGVRSILKIATDITQTRIERAEMAGRMAAIDRSNMLIEIALTGAIATVNDVFLNATGFRREEIVGRHIDDIVIVDHDTQASRKVRRRVDEGKVASGKIQVTTACGRVLNLQATFNAIDDAVGRPAKVLLLASDVTAQMQLEGELERVRAEACAKSAFLANMSHEVRTPMAGVMGFAELLRDSALDADQRKHVGMIIDSGEKMMQLLNDILDVSKIEENKLQIVEGPINLRDRIAQCVELMTPVAEHKGLSLRLRIDDAMPEVIQGDPMRIRQVLLNLIGNAVKFTHEGNITVRIEPDAANRGFYAIKVIDSGIGIPPAMLEKVVAKFVQADHSVQADYGGSGLGLTISSELARLMGGRLEIESTQDLGTRVIVTLPLRECEAQVVLEEAGTVVEPVDLHRSDAPRVLVAEDYDINQLLIEEQMEKLGVRCDIAENGEVAVTMVARAAQQGDPYRLVLMDLRMPVMDGYEAAKALRGAGHTARALPIVALTANAFEEDIAACIIAGMQGHLAKPTSLERLSRLIAEWVPPEQAGDGQEKRSSARSERVREKYYAHRAELLDRLAVLAGGDGCDADAIGELADRLHRFSGTAALFGEEQLGQLARKLESMLRDEASADLREAAAEMEQCMRVAA